MLTKIVDAIQFLTILPFQTNTFRVTEKQLGQSSIFFPMAGLLQGLLLLLISRMLTPFLPLDIVTALLITAAVVSNGGFHLDGLADTVDALASRKDKKTMLAIMKDGSVGPIGAVSIVLSLLIKYLALKNILALSTDVFFVPLTLFPVIARWSIVPALLHGKRIGNDGLGKIFLKYTRRFELIGSSFLAL